MNLNLRAKILPEFKSFLIPWDTETYPPDRDYHITNAKYPFIILRREGSVPYVFSLHYTTFLSSLEALSVITQSNIPLKYNNNFCTAYKVSVRHRPSLTRAYRTELSYHKSLDHLLIVVNIITSTVDNYHRERSHHLYLPIESLIRILLEFNVFTSKQCRQYYALEKYLYLKEYQTELKQREVQRVYKVINSERKVD